MDHRTPRPISPEKLQRYATRIARAVSLLAQSIERGEGVPALDTLAEAAGFSSFHFHRIYRALTGETVAATAVRLRTGRALQALLDPQRSITRIALDQGFSTPQAFARAFRQATGYTPSDLRADPARTETLRDSLMNAQPPHAPLQLSLQSLEPLHLVALHYVGDPAGLNGAYQTLFDWAMAAERVHDITSLFGVALDDPRDQRSDQSRFIAAIAMAAPPPLAPELSALTLAGGYYWVHTHTGDYDGLYAVMDALFAKWPAAFDGERDGRPSFFRYLDDPEQTPAEACRAEIYLPTARED